MKTFDPNNFETDTQKVLCILANNSNSTEGDTPADISRILRETWGLALHWRTVSSILEKNKSLVARRKRNHKWRYTILAKGLEALAVTDSKVTVIDPKNAIQHLKTLHDQLSELEGSIYICDPYLDASTIEHLDSCSQGTTVHLLTHNIKDSGRLRQVVAAFPSTKKSIEIRKTKKAILHDRYIIDKRKMFILGASLNGYGKKQCFFINAGQDVRNSMLDSFKNHWDEASSWPSA